MGGCIRTINNSSDVDFNVLNSSRDLGCSPNGSQLDNVHVGQDRSGQFGPSQGSQYNFGVGPTSNLQPSWRMDPFIDEREQLAGVTLTDQGSCSEGVWSSETNQGDSNEPFIAIEGLVMWDNSEAELEEIPNDEVMVQPRFPEDWYTLPVQRSSTEPINPNGEYKEKKTFGDPSDDQQSFHESDLEEKMSVVMDETPVGNVTMGIGKELKKACSICEVNEKDVTIVPCGHCFCENCASDVSLCPVCQGRVTHRQKMFF